MAVIALAVIALPCRALNTPPTRAAAEHTLMQGHVDDAVAMLNQLIAANQADAEAHLLLCRAFYSEEIQDRAVNECEAALANGLRNDARAQDWMGRAYGRKAGNAGPFAALSLAKKVRTAFETAVQLDPNNTAAVNDLSEYYVGAPSLVGGGADKASALAARVEARLPQPAHRIRGLVAEKNKDYTTAEREFRAAAAVANKPEAWTDLGDFYARRKQTDQAIAALRKARELDTARDASLLDIAGILHDMKRDAPMAEATLRDYLASENKSDASPAFKAHLLLGQLLAASGNKAAAKTEFNAALSLAHDYAPARKALDSL